jgi:hypothetical protein
VGLSAYFMHVVYEDERNSYAWLVDLDASQEAAVIRHMDSDGWVTQSKVAFGEDDPVRLSLPFTGTVKGQFILYYG